MRFSTVITSLIGLTSTLAAAAPLVDEPALALRRPPDEPGYEQYVVYTFESHLPQRWPYIHYTHT